MTDRQPSPGKAGRVRITPDGGGTPYYATIAMADEPTNEGSAWNKANVLPNTLAQKIGLTKSDPQLADALGAMCDATKAINDQVSMAVYTEAYKPGDLNNLRTVSGRHLILGNQGSSYNSYHYPVGQLGLLEVLQAKVGTEQYTVQRYTSITTGSTYIRVYRDGAWGSWLNA